MTRIMSRFSYLLRHSRIEEAVSLLRESSSDDLYLLVQVMSMRERLRTAEMEGNNKKADALLREYQKLERGI